MNNLLILASRVSNLADELEIKNPNLSRAEAISQAFQELKTNE